VISELLTELPKDIARKIANENKNIDNKISNIESALRKEFQNYILSGTIPTIIQLRNFLDKLLNKKTTTVTVTKALKSLIGYYEEFIDDMKSGKRINRKGAHRGMSMTTGYIKSHGTTVTNLKNYQKLHNARKELKFEDITLEWYHTFVQMLKQQNKAFNTIGSQIKNVKNFLKYSYGKGWHKNTIYTHEDFIVLREETDHIYLTETELVKIYKLNLSGNKRLENVRNLFVLACNTGLRYSDLSNLKPTDVVKDDSGYILNVKTQKTSKLVSIPLKKCVVEILHKYNWNLPKPISNQKMNSYLKEIGEKAGINQDVELSKTYNNKSTGVTKPKYSFISSHTARRTLATNMYLNGFEESDIMSITGHKDVKIFKLYLKAESLHRAQKMLKSRSDYFHK
jgi:integrase